MKIEVYTDGSATTKDKPGGYAYVLVINGAKYNEGSGHMASASNNDAELEAAIQGLIAAYKVSLALPVPGIEKTPLEVYLISDSQLILGWASGHYKFKQVSKQEQFQRLRGLVTRMNVQTRWVKGHSGDEHNERCDQLANQARNGLEKKKKKEIAKESGETLIGTKKTGIICIWFKDNMKVIDLENNVIEDYKREIHGPRGSMFEIREEKSR